MDSLVEDAGEFSPFFRKFESRDKIIRASPYGSVMIRMFFSLLTWVIRNAEKGILIPHYEFRCLNQQ